MSRKSLEERLWSKVQRGAADECWPWLRAKNSDGYGLMWDGERQTGAHRVAYRVARGPIGKGLVVMHSCDNPPCCNPAHLSLGTHGDNCADMYRKRRQRKYPELEARIAAMAAADRASRPR